MRIVFFGTPDFASLVLDNLNQEHEILAVVSKAKSACADYARAHGLPLLCDQGQAPVADLYLSCAYGRILSPTLLARSRLAPLNVHFSLLPKWRGAAPVARAILAGEREVGLSIMRMVERLDAGPVCACAPFPVGELGLDELTLDLAQAGADLLKQIIPALARGQLEWREQDDSLASYAAKIGKEETLLDPALSVQENKRKVQASNKSAPARCRICGKAVRILEAKSAPSPLQLDCADGGLSVQRLQAEGKRPVRARDFLNGLRCSTIEWSKI